jgi:DNA polymerase-3 subunit beta
VKFRCDRDDLGDALQAVQRGVATRAGIPALTGVLLEASDDGWLTLTTTDLEVSARLRTQVQVADPGAVLVPARLLADTVKSLSAAPVEVEAADGQATITSAAYEGSMRLLSVEDFPGLQEPGGTTITVPAAVFATAVDQVSRAVSHDEARAVLTGVLVEITPAGALLVATDSYRLAICELVVSSPGEAKVIVPGRALSEAGRAANAGKVEEVQIAVDPTQVAFRVGELTLTSRLIEGEFPPHRALMPENHDNRLEIDRQQFLDAVRRVGLFARDTTPVRLAFESSGVRLLSESPDLGRAEEFVEATYGGDAFTVAFNPQYLLDGLDACVSERIRFDVQDGLKPGVVRDGEGDGFTYLVMPVRVPATVA